MRRSVDAAHVTSRLRTCCLVGCSFGALSAVLPAAAHEEPASAAGLCAPTENTFFACTTRQQKRIALCGAAPSALQYRFGATGHVELSVPEAAAGGVERFRYAAYSRYRTERTDVSFVNQDVAYTVFDDTEGKQHIAGVMTTTPDGKARRVACSGPVASRLAELETMLRCDPDNALNGGSCP
ncbi:hypothetical protein BH11PSE8_BH11PSE8_34940 [soil metagenome]